MKHKKRTLVFNNEARLVHKKRTLVFDNEARLVIENRGLRAAIIAMQPYFNYESDAHCTPKARQLAAQIRRAMKTQILAPKES